MRWHRIRLHTLFGGALLSIFSCSREVAVDSSFALEESVGTVIQDDKWLAFEIDLNEVDLAFYWQNERGENYRTFARLKADLERKNKQLIFATNGGMFNSLFAPLGLYIEDGDLIAPLDTFTNRTGNFYLLPNGIFSINKSGKPSIQPTTNFKLTDSIDFATQSGPMLLIDGEFHPAFIQGSSNFNIRNGVGILPNGKLLFAMSKIGVNFYDFATYFYERGCKNALYLDGFVSRTYLPQANWTKEDGNFGVIIGITKQL